MDLTNAPEIIERHNRQLAYIAAVRRATDLDYGLHAATAFGRCAREAWRDGESPEDCALRIVPDDPELSATAPRSAA